LALIVAGQPCVSFLLPAVPSTGAGAPVLRGDLRTAVALPQGSSSGRAGALASLGLLALAAASRRTRAPPRAKPAVCVFKQPTVPVAADVPLLPEIEAATVDNLLGDLSVSAPSEPQSQLCASEASLPKHRRPSQRSRRTSERAGRRRIGARLLQGAMQVEPQLASFDASKVRLKLQHGIQGKSVGVCRTMSHPNGTFGLSGAGMSRSTSIFETCRRLLSLSRPLKIVFKSDTSDLLTSPF